MASLGVSAPWRKAALYLLLAFLPACLCACPRSCSCPNPKEVHCTFRHLSSAPRNIPKDTERVNLGYNSIEAVGTSDFSNLRQLEMLMLHGNDIGSVGSGSFYHLRSLQILKLSYNKIKSVDSGTFEGLTGLVRLHLDHNQIDFINPFSFDGLTSLKLLQLEGNRLRDLHPHAFTTISLLGAFWGSGLRHLYLADNRLEYLLPGTLQHLSRLEVLSLHGNPWTCDCHLGWLVEWDKKHEGVIKCKKDRASESCAVCASPQTLNNSQIFQLSAQQLSCDRPSLQSPLKLGENSVFEDQEPDLPYTKDLERPLGDLALMLSDSHGNRAHVACDVNRPGEGTSVAWDKLKSSEDVAVNVTLQTQLECEIDRDTLQNLWRLVAYYYESPAVLERGSKHENTSKVTYQYAQVTAEDSPYFTELKGHLEANPAWLLQPKVTIQLNRRKTTSKKLVMNFSTFISKRISGRGEQDDPVPSWALIPRGNPGRVQIVLEHSKVIFDCDVLTSGDQSVEWMLPDLTILDKTDSQRIASEQNRLVIENASLSDGGLYHCFVRTEAEVEIVSYRLVVRERLLSPGGLNGKRMSVENGESLRLPCSVTSPHPVETGWILPNHQILKASNAKGRIYVSPNNTLIIQNVLHEDAGEYSCLAANLNGADMLSHQVVVAGKKRDEPQDVTVLRGQVESVDGEDAEGSGYQEIKRFTATHTPQRGVGRHRGSSRPHRPGFKGKKIKENARKGNKSVKEVDPGRWAQLLAKARAKVSTVQPITISTITTPASTTSVDLTTSSTTTSTSMKVYNTKPLAQPPLKEPKDGRLHQKTDDSHVPTLTSLNLHSTTSSPSPTLSRKESKNHLERPVLAGRNRLNNNHNRFPNQGQRPFNRNRSPFRRPHLPRPTRPLKTTTEAAFAPSTSAAPESTTLKHVPFQATNKTPKRKHFTDTRGKVGVRQKSSQVGSGKQAPVIEFEDRSKYQEFDEALSTTPYPPVVLPTTDSERYGHKSIEDEDAQELRSTTSPDIQITENKPPITEKPEVTHNKHSLDNSGSRTDVLKWPIPQQEHLTTDKPVISKNRPRVENSGSRIDVLDNNKPKLDNSGSRTDVLKWPIPQQEQLTTDKPVINYNRPKLDSSGSRTDVLDNNRPKLDNSGSRTDVLKWPIPQQEQLTTDKPVINYNRPKLDSSGSRTDVLKWPIPQQEHLTTDKPVINNNRPKLDNSESRMDVLKWPIPQQEHLTTDKPVINNNRPKLDNSGSRTDVLKWPIPQQEHLTTDKPVINNNRPKLDNSGSRTDVLKWPIPQQEHLTTDKPVINKNRPKLDNSGSRTDVLKWPIPQQEHLTTDKPVINYNRPKLDNSGSRTDVLKWPIPQQEHLTTNKPVSNNRPRLDSSGVISGRPNVPVHPWLIQQRKQISATSAPYTSLPFYTNRIPVWPRATTDLPTTPPPVTSPSRARDYLLFNRLRNRYRQSQIDAQRLAQLGKLVTPKPRTQQPTPRPHPAPNVPTVYKPVTPPSVIAATSKPHSTASILQGSRWHYGQSGDRSKIQSTALPFPNLMGSGVKPRIMTTESDTVSALAETNVLLRCQASGDPKPAISWTKVSTGATIQAGTKHGQRFEVFPNGTFFIKNVQLQDRGQYLCAAQNKFGSDRTVINLAVQTEPPRIQGPKFRDVSVYLGKLISLDCVASGKPQAQVSWILPNRTFVREVLPVDRPVSLSPNGTLRIQSANFSSKGNYKCIASNAAGADTLTYYLHVAALPPTIKEDASESIPIHTGRNMYVHCTAKGEPEPLLRWLLPGGTQLKPTQFIGRRLFVFPNGTLYIKTILPTDAGKYECSATNVVGLAQRVVKLDIRQESVGPWKGPSEKHSVSAMYGSTVFLHCPESVDSQRGTVWRLPTKTLLDHRYSPLRHIAAFPNGTLRILQLTEKDGGSYLCMYQKPNGEDVELFQLDVLMKPPKIENMGSQQKRVTNGENFVVDCVASGLPDPEVTWSLPDGTMINNALQSDDSGGRSRRYVIFENGTLLMQQMGKSDEGDYTCYAKNTLGEDAMKVSVQVVPNSPRIAYKDQTTLRVSLGQSAQIKCDATGEPAPTIIWISPRNEMITSSSLKYETLNDGTLIIHKVTLADQGKYTCVARNLAGDDIKNVKLQVDVREPHINGKKGQTHSRILAISYQAVLLHCEAEAVPDPLITWTTPYGMTMPKPYTGGRFQVHKNGTLEIRGIRKTDEGRFSCVAKNGLGEASLAVDLEVASLAEKPSFPLPNIEVLSLKPDGEDITLNCQAIGKPKPDFVWILPNNTALAPGMKLQRFVHSPENGTLHIFKPVLGDKGVYRCLAKNIGGQAEKRYALEPGRKPQIREKTAAPLKISFGRTVNMPCSVEGWPQAVISWTLPNGLVLDRPQVIGRVTFLSNGTLQLKETAKSDRGTYVCKATNTFGSSTLSYPVTIMVFPPQITSAPPSITKVGKGSPVTLRCIASGIPKPDISWTLPGRTTLVPNNRYTMSGIYMTEEGSLVIQDPSLMHSGIYKCNAKNALGMDFKATYLQVN